MGRDAGVLTSLFGQPNADVREGAGRKLQYAGPICVLDAYLYPKGSSRAGGHLGRRAPDRRQPDRQGQLHRRVAASDQ